MVDAKVQLGCTRGSQVAHMCGHPYYGRLGYYPSLLVVSMRHLIISVVWEYGMVWYGLEVTF